MKFSSMILPAAALTMLFAACQDEDFGFTTKEVRSAKYDQEFIKAFGEVDPNQDWSMTAETRALVNLPNIQGTAKMNIMTGDPHNASTRLLGQVWLQNGQAETTFDAIEGKNNVFVTVEQDGKYKLYGQYNIVNGMLCIGNVEVPAFAPITRAEIGPCNTTKSGNPVSIDVINIPTDEKIGYSYFPEGAQAATNKTYQEWIDYALSDIIHNANNPTIYTDASLFIYKYDQINFEHAELKETANYNEDGTISYIHSNGWEETHDVATWKTYYAINGSEHTINAQDGPWKLESIILESFICDKSHAGSYFYAKDTNPNNWVIKTDGSVTDYYGSVHPQWQYLSNVKKEAATPWTVGWGASLFGKGALFQESVPYFDATKMALYGDNNIEDMEKGLEIITTGDPDPITLPYIFGCTAFSNQFGYVYWTEGQDPLLQPHYVLIDDARPTSNVYYNAYGTQAGGTAVSSDNMSSTVLNAQNAGQWKDTEQGMLSYLAQANSEVYGTAYTLVYFDENGTASYSFPEGVHIAFFIDDLGSASNQTNHTGYNGARYNYSLPELNERIGHLSAGQRLKREGAPVGLVKCIPFTLDGVTFLGFGDNSGDEDLNDIVFALSGPFVPKYTTAIAPIYWHINKEHHHEDNDIFEQNSVSVGGDYIQPIKRNGEGKPVLSEGNVQNIVPANGTKKFLGWSTTPDNSSNDLFETINGHVASVTPIHYYAIWEIEQEIVPDPEWQSWIFACEDLGGSYDYDFNDLVFAVQKTAITGTDNVKLELIPLAAGGTLNAEVWYNDTKVEEIHKLLGSDDYKTQNLGGTEGTAVTLAESISASTTVSSIARSIKIQVTQGEGDVKNGSYTLSHTDHNKNYKTPEILILPGGWDWPYEGVLITDVYPGFASWSGDINATGWIDNKKEGTVAGEHYIVNPLKGGNEPVGPTPGVFEDITLTQEQLAATNYDLSSYITENGDYEITVLVSPPTYIQFVPSYNGANFGYADTPNTIKIKGVVKGNFGINKNGNESNITSLTIHLLSADNSGEGGADGELS